MAIILKVDSWQLHLWDNLRLNENMCRNYSKSPGTWFSRQQLKNNIPPHDSPVTEISIAYMKSLTSKWDYRRNKCGKPHANFFKQLILHRLIVSHTEVKTYMYRAVYIYKWVGVYVCKSGINQLTNKKEHLQ